MILRRLSLAVFIFVFALCVVHVMYYYPLLPEKVASHFGLSGQPDAWSTKTFFVTRYFVITGILAIIFLGISLGFSKIPVSLINLPNKDFWFLQEQRQKTVDFLSHYFLWFASATLLLQVEIMNQTFQVNLGKADSLKHPMVSLGLYLGFMVMWISGLFIRFGKRKKSLQRM